jgi:hypothetical protein
MKTGSVAYCIKVVGDTGGFYGTLPMGFKIPLGRSLLTFVRVRKLVPVRHEDKANAMNNEQ